MVEAKTMLSNRDSGSTKSIQKIKITNIRSRETGKKRTCGSLYLCISVCCCGDKGRKTQTFPFNF